MLKRGIFVERIVEYLQPALKEQLTTDPHTSQNYAFAVYKTNDNILIDSHRYHSEIGPEHQQSHPTF